MTENSDVKETLDSLIKDIDGFVAAKTVVGEPIRIGETIVVPLADVSFAVGAGSFGSKSKNDGGGAGGRMNPCAVLIIQDGSTRLVSVKNMDGVSKALDLIPDLVNRFAPGGTEKE